MLSYCLFHFILLQVNIVVKFLLRETLPAHFFISDKKTPSPSFKNYGKLYKSVRYFYKGRGSLKRLALILPVVILVFSLAVWFLSNNYGEIAQGARMLISLGGAVLSGVLTYFLFPKNERKI
jgi:hypothetical protein